jgi:TatA/E family protein of Tat protein translocase
MTTGGTELLVVLAIAVVLFGPKKLPELARTIGHAVGEYHKATKEFENEMRKTSTAIDREVTTATSVEQGTAGSKGLQPKTGLPPRSTHARPSHQTSPRKNIASSTSSKTIGNEGKKVKEIAKNLGIDPANKNDDQLLREISQKTKKSG